jgi:hypothetical protein
VIITLRWRQHVVPKTWYLLVSTKLYGVTSQTTVFFTFIAVRISNEKGVSFVKVFLFYEVKHERGGRMKSVGLFSPWFMAVTNKRMKLGVQNFT